VDDCDSLFAENGPYTVDPTTLELVKNKYTWNQDHHMVSENGIQVTDIA